MGLARCRDLCLSMAMTPCPSPGFPLRLGRCASFRASVPEEPSVPSPAMCSVAPPVQRSAFDSLQEPMIPFQSAMQRQMEMLTSFVVNSQPLVVPSLPQDPPEAITSQPSSVEPPPPTQVEQEVMVPSSGHAVVTQPKSVYQPADLQIEDISPAPSVPPSWLPPMMMPPPLMANQLGMTPLSVQHWKCLPFSLSVQPSDHALQLQPLHPGRNTCGSSYVQGLLMANAPCKVQKDKKKIIQAGKWIICSTYMACIFAGFQPGLRRGQISPGFSGSVGHGGPHPHYRH